MSVSSYLEAFLTVYGWDMYYVFYLLFASLGLYLYPVAKAVIEAYVGYLSGSEYADTNYMKQARTSLILIGLVFLTAVVPSVRITLDDTEVKSVCVAHKDVMQVNKGASGDYFDNSNTRVPMLAWIAMAVGQGINGVIYSQTPCAMDVTEAHKALMNINLENAENPVQLKSELNRFIRECHNRASQLADDIINKNKFGPDLAADLKAVLASRIDEPDVTERTLLKNFDSSFLRDYFYSPLSPLRINQQAKSIPPLLASNPVEGISGYEQGSSQQGIDGSPPSCYEWWTGSNALRSRIAEAFGNSMAMQVAKKTGVRECQPNVVWNYRGGPRQKPTINEAACRERIIDDLYQGNGEKFISALFKSAQGAGKTDGVLSGDENANLTYIAAAGVGASILGKVLGVDVAGGLIGQAAGFYMTIYISKLILKFLLPMILMAIYMFWGLYLLIGEYKAMTVIRGMILIIALTIMPGLWAIVEHLDDKLWDAMYGTSGLGDPFNMLLLDIATSIFQITIVFVVFFLINEAGGGSAGGAVRDSKSSGDQAGGFAGRNIGAKVGGIGGMAGKAGGKGWNWAKNTGSKFKQRMNPSSYKVKQPGS